MADVPENTVESLQTQLKALSDKLAEKDAQIETLNGAIDEDKKSMIARREAAKEAEAKALEEQQKYAELYAKTKKEYQDYKEQYSAEKLEQIQKQYDNLINAQKTRLLNQIPEEDRELFMDLSVEKLEKIVEKMGGNIVGVDATRAKPTNGATKKWGEMSEKEKLDLTAADPKKAKELMAEAIKK